MQWNTESYFENVQRNLKLKYILSDINCALLIKTVNTNTESILEMKMYKLNVLMNTKITHN